MVMTLKVPPTLFARNENMSTAPNPLKNVSKPIKFLKCFKLLVTWDWKCNQREVILLCHEKLFCK
ncbi:CLUMA_CG005034, isoform A [Clunio marinus]|uniref:CLUMA_CG005034, isoform A n=1 Tax=Clunio marinus TaxID=568069 RepID=A0A1J1HZ13_9DIPT|nr:CLUMA_CG005034, isoform A [Clunio marinus]